MRLTALTVLTIAALLTMPAAYAIEWPRPPWSPEMALGVQLAQFEAKNLTLETALLVLDNECGLVFGMVETRDRATAPANITLDMHDTTVAEVVEKLKALGTDYRFNNIGGVIVVTPKSAPAHRLGFLDDTVERFDLADATPARVSNRLRELLKSLEGAPPLRDVPTMGVNPGRPKASLHLKNARVVDVLSQAAAASEQSWLYAWPPRAEEATFLMGRAWGLPMDAMGSFVVRLAPGAPREPTANQPPSREVVEERVQNAVKKGRSALHAMDAAVTELVDLLNDPFARGAAMAGIEVIGAARFEEGAAALALHILLTSHPEAQAGTDWMTRQAAAMRAGGAQGVSALTVYAMWVENFPCVAALDNIGRPAVPYLLDELTMERETHECDGGYSPTIAAAWPTTRIILLCECLKRILGDQDAIDELLKAAEAQEDADKAQRLRDAANRIKKGLIPELP